LFAQPTKRPESGAYLRNPAQHAEKCENKSCYRINAKENNSAIWLRLVVYGTEYQMHQRDQPKGPEKSAQENAPAERMQPVHEATFMR
jgi:hypothetical protein